MPQDAFHKVRNRSANPRISDVIMFQCKRRVPLTKQSHLEVYLVAVLELLITLPPPCLTEGVFSFFFHCEILQPAEASTLIHVL